MTAALGVPPPTLATWVAAAIAAIVVVLGLFAIGNRVLLRMALRNLPRRRAQTALIVLGLMLASLIITAAMSVGDTLTYSLQRIEMRQIGGIDEAIARPSNQPPDAAGAGTADADFFTPTQAARVVDLALADPNVDSAAGVIVSPGAVSDSTSGQSASENVVMFGVPDQFDRLWARGLRTSAGTTVRAADLPAGQVYLGSSIADRLNARTGHHLQLLSQGQTINVTVAGVLDNEINPTIADEGPVVGSVLMPIATIRTLLNRPHGFNLVYVHNRGAGDVDDLGPNGSTGQEIVRRLQGSLIDQQSAQDLFAFVKQPAIHSQIQLAHDQATFLDPRKRLAQDLLDELARPTASAQFKALAGDRFDQSVMYEAAVKADGPSANGASGGTYTAGIQARLSALGVDTSSAMEIRDLIQDPRVRGTLTEMAGASTPASASLGNTAPGTSPLAGLLAQSADGQLTPEFKSTLNSENAVDQLRLVVAQTAPDLLPRYAASAAALRLDALKQYKADGVVFAQTTGLIAGSALLGVSFFSLAVGVLLIFLIFVMLAAERRAEMGMSRAVGLKRRHLTQMFLFEGFAYTLFASFTGVVLGIGVGDLMVRVISSIFTGMYKGLDLIYHVEWPTIVIAACLGIAITFIVVAVSAHRVSRLNIVAAIRDLDESEQREAGRWLLVKSLVGGLADSAGRLWHGHPLDFFRGLAGALGGLTWTAMGAVFGFMWMLFKRGPLALLVGVGVAQLGLASKLETVYGIGVSLLIIGTGMLIRWVLGAFRLRQPLRARIGFTLAALGLLVYWGRPFGRVETLLHIDKTLKLADLNGGADLFALTALMVLLGAIWAVMYNSDLLIRFVMTFTGLFGNLSATARTSMSYPMATKFRTGMAVAMFAIVTFMIVYMSVFKDVLTQNFENVNQLSGGWQIAAGTPDQVFVPTPGVVYPTDIATAVHADPRLNREIRSVGWEDELFGISLQRAHGATPSGTGPSSQSSFFPLHVVDDGYLDGTGFAIQPRAAGLSSDRAVWNAVRDHPGYAVIDSSAFTGGPGSPALVSGIGPNDLTFKPFQLDVRGFDRNGQSMPAWRLTVVGFLTRPEWNGLYVSTTTAIEAGAFAPPSAQPYSPSSQDESLSLAGTRQLPQLAPTGYYFSLEPGTDPNRARLDLGRLLVKDQLEPVSVSDQVAQGNSAIVTLLNLLTGFLALGLIVGVAGLGVISTRAVVERRQQIGMMRALGFRRSHVQRSFLMESSFIAVLGLLIGSLVGLWQSYRFFVTDKSVGTVVFHVPVIELSLILLGSYLATLLTTYLPARSAAGVAPAEALRFE